MLALAARRLGYRVHTYSPERDSPTGQVADAEIVGDYDDLDAVRRFADGVDVVTFEFENVPSASVAAIAERALVRPAGSVLHTTQHRGREKGFLSRAGLPVAPFALVDTLDDLSAARGAARPARRPQDRELRLRRQGPGADRARRGRPGRLGSHRPPAGRPRGVRRLRARAVGGGRARRRRADRPLRRHRERARPAHPRRVGGAGAGAAAGRARRRGHRPRDARGARRRRRPVRRAVPDPRRPAAGQRAGAAPPQLRAT